jgi:hypothetical protein
MDWLAAVDGYCERLGSGLWAEPANALSNLGFLVAAGVMTRRVGAEPGGRALCLWLAAIGVGSGLFHTLANRLTGLLDVLPILGFILAYVFLASRDFLHLRTPGAALAALGFIPYALLLTPLFRALPGFAVSAFYWPVPVLILGYAGLLRRRAPATARGLAAGAGLLSVSLVARSADMAVCAAFPLGTHVLWHLLNALMLAWMIEVRRRHLAGGGGPGWLAGGGARG